MRSGYWRGVVVALSVTSALAIALGLVGTTAVNAGVEHFSCTIPDLVPAVDLNTGGPFMAPPVPYGHYTGYGDVTGRLTGAILGLGHGLGLGTGCGLCGGVGCDACGGCPKAGLCLPSLGHNKGHGLPSLCFPSLCLPSCGFGPKHCLPSAQCAKPSIQCAAPVVPCVKPSIQCAKPALHCALPACGFMGKHGLPGCCMAGAPGSPCGSCGGAGCGLCGGTGLCAGAGHLGAGLPAGLLGGGHHIRWFLGAGGPVPLTPGYVPYVVATRSPRDFFAFPPFNPDAP
jgi:hypothetical protein